MRIVTGLARKGTMSGTDPEEVERWNTEGNRQPEKSGHGSANRLKCVRKRLTTCKEAPHHRCRKRCGAITREERGS